MTKSERDAATLIGMAIVALTLFVVGLIGWVMNIIALVHTQTLDGLTIARAIGIFVVPVGSVLGYF